MKIANVLESGSWGELTPDVLEKGVGGREGSLIRLSKEWAKLGHEVHSFIPTSKPLTIREGTLSRNGSHSYFDVRLASAILRNMPYDAVVSWENPSIFADERVRDIQGVRVLEYQVAHVHPQQSEELPFASAVCALSPWHAEFLAHDNPSLDPSKIRVQPNGVDLSLYPKGPRKPPIGESPRFVYSSSPDRGLWHLLRLWPQLRERWPGAVLAVGYDATKWARSTTLNQNRVGEMATEILLLMAQPGISDLGRVGQTELAKYQSLASAWLYPCDTIQPTETGCISAVEAAASGTPMLITDCDCLPSEFGSIAAVCSLPFDPGLYLDTLDGILQQKDMWVAMSEAGREFAAGRSWEKLAPRWIDMFEELR